MKTVWEIKGVLAGLKEELRRMFKVKEIGIFGSVVRGEQVENSDIDILVDFEEGATLLDLSGLALYLEERLNQKVDIVSKRALRKEIKTSVCPQCGYKGSKQKKRRLILITRCIFFASE